MASLNLSDLPQPPIHDQQRIIDGCAADEHPEKISLTYGAYRDYDGKPWVLPIVQSTAKEVISSSNLNMEYVGPYGTPSFRSAMLTLMGQKAIDLASQNKLNLVQTIGGTCALRLAMELLRDIGATKVYASSPTWTLHLGIAKQLGYKIKTYRYWDKEKMCLDMDGMMSDIRQAEEGSVIILQLCAHNPTGVDPTIDQWRQIIACIQERRLFPILDCAYLGLATGNLDIDREPITLFLQENIQAFYAFTMSKSLGMYSERLGSLAYTVDDEAAGHKVWQAICSLIMVSYMSNNGIFADVTCKIINNPEKRAVWESHLRDMVKRQEYSRHLLYDNLKELKVSGNWDHILKQRGMFCFTGLTKRQCEFLRENHVHLFDDGRMNIGDITDKNVKRLTTLMKAAVEIK